MTTFDPFGLTALRPQPPVETVEKWDPNQPRDDRGRWTSGGDPGEPSHGAVNGISLRTIAAMSHGLSAPSVTSPNAAVTKVVNELLVDSRVAEPDITAGLRSIAHALGGKMEGLDFRFKSPAGILEKVDRKVALSDNTVTPAQAAAQISDVLRYTMTLPEASYTTSVIDAIASMRDHGYDIAPANLENNWVRGDAYNGINASFTDRKTGMNVEIQFHTPESWRVKNEVNHADYETLRSQRSSMTDQEARVLWTRMQRTSDALPQPSDILTLGRPVFRPFK